MTAQQPLYAENAIVKSQASLTQHFWFQSWIPSMKILRTVKATVKLSENAHFGKP